MRILSIYYFLNYCGFASEVSVDSKIQETVNAVLATILKEGRFSDTQKQRSLECKAQVDELFQSPRHLMFKQTVEDCTFDVLASLDYQKSMKTTCGTIANYIQSISDQCYYFILLTSLPKSE